MTGARQPFWLVVNFALNRQRDPAVTARAVRAAPHKTPERTDLSCRAAELKPIHLRKGLNVTAHPDCHRSGRDGLGHRSGTDDDTCC
jgi:hypothetical protein